MTMNADYAHAIALSGPEDLGCPPNATIRPELPMSAQWTNLAREYGCPVKKGFHFFWPDAGFFAWDTCTDAGWYTSDPEVVRACNDWRPGWRDEFTVTVPEKRLYAGVLNSTVADVAPRPDDSGFGIRVEPDEEAPAGSFPWGAYSKDTEQLQHAINALAPSKGLCPTGVDGKLGKKTCALARAVDFTVPATCRDFATSVPRPPCTQAAPPPPADIEEQVQRFQRKPRLTMPMKIGLGVAALALIGGGVYLVARRTR